MVIAASLSLADIPGTVRLWRQRRVEFLLSMIAFLGVALLGVLAGIAIPVFLSQRAKGRDTSTKADVSTVGKEIATYFVDGTGTLTLDTATAGQITVKEVAPGTYTSGAIKLSSGTKPSASASANLGDANNWCVSLTNDDGKQKDYKYSAAGGLQTGTC